MLSRSLSSLVLEPLFGCTSGKGEKKNYLLKEACHFSAFFYSSRTTPQYAVGSLFVTLLTLSLFGVYTSQTCYLHWNLEINNVLPKEYWNNIGCKNYRQKREKSVWCFIWYKPKGWHTLAADYKYRWQIWKKKS